VKVCALAYNSAGFSGLAGNDVNIYRLFETGSREVSFTESEGGTPSVAAMGAVPGLMRRLLGRASDNLLIHITDGFPHDEKPLGTSIEDLIEVLAKKHKIDTYCLAVMGYGAGAEGRASNQDNLLKKAYGDSYEKLNSYTDLPEALRKLLYNLLVAS
jgi:Mg-chelatase subunit ChlD